MKMLAEILAGLWKGVDEEAAALGARSGKPS
jgi:hypothetical protein